MDQDSMELDPDHQVDPDPSNPVILRGYNIEVITQL